MSNTTKELVNKDELYIDIANTVGLNKNIVKKICEKQFRTMHKIISDHSEDVVKLPYIGKVVKHIKKNKRSNV